MESGPMCYGLSKCQKWIKPLNLPWPLTTSMCVLHCYWRHPFEILEGRVVSVVYSLVAGPCCILGSKG